MAATGCRTDNSLVNSDIRSLQGTWDVVYQEINGTKLPDEKMARLFHAKIVFVGHAMHYTADLQGFDFRFTYNLYPGHRLKEIDLRVMETLDEKGTGQEFYGIYRLRGDELRICYSKAKRPQKLVAGEESHNTLIVLKRNSPHPVE